MSLSKLVATQAAARPDAPALLAPGFDPISWSALHGHVHSWAAGLRAAGASASTPVATLVPNGLRSALSFLGVTAVAPCVPLASHLPIDELRLALTSAGARYLVCEGEDEALARQVADELRIARLDATSIANAGAPDPGSCAAPDADDLALLLHTSGTTAHPKLVPLTHANLAHTARRIAASLALTPEDRCINVMPLFHVHGLVGALLASVSAGASVVCLQGFDAEGFVDGVERFHPSWYTAAPTIHQAVLALAPRLRQRVPAHRFRFVRSASAALSPTTLRALELQLDSPVIEAYGLTEVSSSVTSNPLPPGVRKPGSAGPSMGAELAILDERGAPVRTGEVGEIAVRGSGVMRGYGGDPALNEAAFVDGWFRTGDLGRLDADGYLFVAGRLKEIVNRGGEKVSPREVDEALLEHPDVAQVAAFGVPHPTLGEDLCAAVVRRPGAQPGAAALRGFLLERLAAHKVPSRILFVDALPRGRSGKVQRIDLHRQLAALLDAASAAPATALERELAQTWQSVLDTRTLPGAQDNFFALGGDSLMAMQVVAAVNRVHGIELEAPALFHHPTLAELARVVDEQLLRKAARDARLQREIDALSDEEVERLLAQAGDEVIPPMPADPGR